MRSYLVLVILIIALPCMAAVEAPSSLLRRRCEALQSLHLQHASVSSAAIVLSLTQIEGLKGSPQPVQEVPAFCRISVLDKPSADSIIHSEVWMPLRRWNHRYRGQGNGGFGGSIPYDLMAHAIKEGYATSGTDAGHIGSDTRFAIDHPEKIKDFGWRAIHDMATQSKAIIEAFYGSLPKYSYFASCSNGGREAFMEAQRFPADYNGILAGDPAYNWTALMASGTKDAQVMLADNAHYIQAKKISAIASAVLSACDQLDGLKDGVIADPRNCHFNPATLRCATQDESTCLLPEQIESLNTLYAAKLDKDSREVFPGYLPGAEDGPGGWSLWITGASPGTSLFTFFGVSFFADFVHQQAGWQLKDFEFDRDLQLANTRTAQDLNATDTNIRPYTSMGGKLIIYNGWNDPAVPALSTIDYYNRLAQTLGPRTTGDSVRLYMVPGMQHCNGGSGAVEFGQDGDEIRSDEHNDIFTALEHWVELGKPPARLNSKAKSEGGSSPRNDITRPLCPYPLISGYDEKFHSYSCVHSNSR